jgi:hypothetical protein
MKKSQLITRSIMTTLVAAAFIVRSASAMSDGYILAASYQDNFTFLFDMGGAIIHKWDHSKLATPQSGYSAYLLPSGNLLRSAIVSMMGGMGAKLPYPTNAAPQQGAINEVDPSDKLVWTYTYSNDTVMTHHDMKSMPNGNILAISFIIKTKAQLIAAHVDTTLLTPQYKTMLADKIIEIKRNSSGGEIIWEWSVFDHTVAPTEAAAHPELISGSINSALYYGQWMHLNGIDYDSTNDLILFSSRLFSECYVIDHGTTRQEAAGHTGGKHGKGGDILYRWGKPGNYGASGATTLDVLHSPTWLHPEAGKPGNILFFHNNEHDSTAGSQVIEIAPPYDASGIFVKPSAGAAFGPAQPAWLFAPKSDFYSPHMSTALRMPGGNTIAEEAYPMNDTKSDTSCSRVTEIAADKSIVAKFLLRKSSEPGKFNPAKIMYYPSSYAGIQNLFAKLGNASVLSANKALRTNPFSIIFHSGNITFNNIAGCAVDIFNLQGKKAFSAKPMEKRFVIRGMTPGSYIVNVQSKNEIRRMMAVLQ